MSVGVAKPLGALTRPEGRDYRVRMKHAPSTGSAPHDPRPDLPLSSPRDPVHWFFPRPHVHEGIPFANAVTGALVWGEGRFLRVTLGRVDLWDHRSGMPWTAAQNFRDLRAALEAHDEARVRALFDAPGHAPGVPDRPFPIHAGLVRRAAKIEKGFPARVPQLYARR
jgi:hypothetical protein